MKGTYTPNTTTPQLMRPVEVREVLDDEHNKDMSLYKYYFQKYNI